MKDRIKNTPVLRVEIRVEPNHNASHVLWDIRGDDGTRAHGFAKSASDAMHDAANFVEAMMMPRVGGLGKKELKIVSNQSKGGN